MEGFIVFWLLLVSRSVLCDEPLLEACFSEDKECLKRSITQYFNNNYEGKPELDITPIDPLLLTSCDLVLDNSIGATLKYKNLNVTGLRNQKLTKVDVDIASKSILLSAEVTLNVGGDVEIDYTKKSKNFLGSFTSNATAIATGFYNYKPVKNDQGVDIFEFGPETITCKLVTERPYLQWSPELLTILMTDEDTKNLSDETKKEINRQQFCTVVTESYRRVINNFQTATKKIPATTFLKNW